MIACFIATSSFASDLHSNFSKENNNYFSAASQHIFATREPLIIRQAVEKIKSHNGMFGPENFYNIREILANERQSIAIFVEKKQPKKQRNMTEAQSFGVIRQNYAWPYMTLLKPHENNLLVHNLVGSVLNSLRDMANGLTPQNTRFIKTPDFVGKIEDMGKDTSHFPGEQVIAEYLKNMLIPNCTLDKFFCKNIMNNTLELFEISNSVVLDDKTVSVSKIYGFVTPVKDASEKINIDMTGRLLGATPHFAILHTRGADNIEALTQAASKEWCAALNLQLSHVPSEEEFKEKFLPHMARFYWLHTHACPYHRGSEAITKWMVKVAASYYGWEIFYTENFISRFPFYLNMDVFSRFFTDTVTKGPPMQDHS
jgi:hypothetical protein